MNAFMLILNVYILDENQVKLYVINQNATKSYAFGLFGSVYVLFSP